MDRVGRVAHEGMLPGSRVKMLERFESLDVDRRLSLARVDAKASDVRNLHDAANLAALCDFITGSRAGKMQLG
jgi:hypothetical protein